jgi:hypothetical protein
MTTDNQNIDKATLNTLLALIPDPLPTTAIVTIDSTVLGAMPRYTRNQCYDVLKQLGLDSLRHVVTDDRIGSSEYVSADAKEGIVHNACTRLGHTMNRLISMHGLPAVFEAVDELKLKHRENIVEALKVIERAKEAMEALREANGEVEEAMEALNEAKEQVEEAENDADGYISEANDALADLGLDAYSLCVDPDSDDLDDAEADLEALLSKIDEG